MKQDIKNCVNCKKNFTIEPDDFGFYEKIKVPPPTFCPDCRRQRRWAWRNNMSLYNRKCDLCGKGIISIYHPDSGIIVYCNKCWWSDKWDPKSYGVDYDFSKPFFAQFIELMKRVPHMAIVNDDGIASLNCEYTHDWWFSKNCYMCFSGWYVENVMYSFFILKGKDIVDCMNIRSESNWIYECILCSKSYQTKYSEICLACVDSQFLYDCHNCKHVFGCVGLRNTNYCIFNKQYTKEQYGELMPKIMEHMDTMPFLDKKGNKYSYGEYFPVELSYFGYNESCAMEQFPLAKKEANEAGYNWQNNIQKTTGKETLLPGKIPESIDDVGDSILEEILACTNCKRNYKIVSNELNFYKKMNIPIPRRCFHCRHQARVKRTNPFKLWHRSCMCKKENHFHGAGDPRQGGARCPVEFETSYAPDRPEIVYCEKCYQAEVY
ncbi:hypothetical protein A2740_01610 [Candidatus Nomurabacteria bacterium RIFCSPHIGHO2_01_FULL_43_16]|nr:MAG: hypothetical protein A2740_01610 [Candidatus Nomurabacteria bacterium RIFCSPHIGHO2_01_FULL_43_16]OGI97413.1 MAG: hypothetical protein A3A11_02240 [Candidatus Nomurabacteria bacterium RIFCSPLOWO2_01_FULL_43_15]OGJ14342.1 MAG: hypothetical protein A2587_01215 [Candidatus Nomurabacteria bacterium RIFOXYD1_FULL_42_14]